MGSDSLSVPSKELSLSSLADVFQEWQLDLACNGVTLSDEQVASCASLADFIQLILRNTSKSQVEFAQESGVSRNFIQAVLRGEYPRANLSGSRVSAGQDERYSRVAKALGLNEEVFCQVVELYQGLSPLALSVVDPSSNHIVRAMGAIGSLIVECLKLNIDPNTVRQMAHQNLDTVLDGALSRGKSIS